MNVISLTGFNTI